MYMSSCPPAGDAPGELWMFDGIPFYRGTGQEGYTQYNGAGNYLSYYTTEAGADEEWKRDVFVAGAGHSYSQLLDDKRQYYGDVIATDGYTVWSGAALSIGVNSADKIAITSTTTQFNQLTLHLDDIAAYWGNSFDGQISYVPASNIMFIERLAGMAGIAGGISHNVGIAAGGAAAASIWGATDALDGIWESGLLAETDGAGSYREPVFKVPYYAADYGAAWAAPPNPTPAGIVNGCEFVAYNSNGAGSYRRYSYLNGGWHYVAMT
jgi:hypothetical protein